MARWNIEDILNNSDELSEDDINEIFETLDGNEIVLYHGSNIAVSTPDADYKNAKYNTDFGLGFYTTSTYEQACSWAHRKCGKENYGSPTVSVYIYDPTNVAEYSFGDDYTEEWLDFIVTCRQDGRNYYMGEVIYGCVADDDVVVTINDYMKGLLRKEDALEQLRFKDFSDQYCFTTQSVINNSLTYKGYINV